MTKVLKTYPDGSEMTLQMAVVTAGVCVVAGAAGGVVGHLWENYKYNRFYKKNPHLDATKKKR